MRKRSKQWRSGVAMLLSLLCCQIGCARPTNPSQMKNILVFGDSLSAGLGISPREAWPMLLLDKLRPISSHFLVTVGMQVPSSDADYMTKFGKMFGELAKKNHAALVPYLPDGVAGTPELN